MKREEGVSVDDVLLAILAGGNGERLQPLTTICPKPLLQLRGCCGLQHAFHKALQSNINQVVIIGHHHFEFIKKAANTMPARPKDLTIVKEDQPRGTGGCLHAAMNFEFNKLIILYTDIFFETSLEKIIADHGQAGADITLGISFEEIEVPYGVVDCNGNRVLEFKEKKSTVPVFAGVAVISREFLADVKWGASFGFDALVNQALLEQLCVVSSEVSGWTHLTPDILPLLTPLKEMA
jgi:UDP-2,4-diacetamido-2,4,6-trideoxy-beta-L-gulopyranose hydrolase